MKEPLKDRIDVLLDKARSGDAKAQMLLAKQYYKGSRLVNKSLDNARYWSFKAASLGLGDAEAFYNDITSGLKPKNTKIDKNKIVDKIFSIACYVALISFFGGILGLWLIPDSSPFYNFSGWLTLSVAAMILPFGIAAYIFENTDNSSFKISIAGIVLLVASYIVIGILIF